MGGLERTDKLSLALDRVYEYGHIYLDEKIATPELKKAIELIRKAIDEISDWDEFIEDAYEWD
jgi:hypothetical protein